jgi:hypothetical protein
MGADGSTKFEWAAEGSPAIVLEISERGGRTLRVLADKMDQRYDGNDHAEVGRVDVDHQS